MIRKTVGVLTVTNTVRYAITQTTADILSEILFLLNTFFSNKHNFAEKSLLYYAMN
jgi:hypothetical protein